MIQITPTVKQLLIINIICYIGANVVGGAAYDMLAMYFPGNPQFHFWQIITHMFMHASFPNISHILFNMFALYTFGSALERFWGGKKFLFFYISCGLGSALLHNLVNYWEYSQVLDMLRAIDVPKSEITQMLSSGSVPQYVLQQVPMEKLQQMYSAFNSPMLGASGAIYGLMVAFAFMFPDAEMFLLFIPVPIKAKYLLPGIITLDLVLGLYGSSFFGAGGTGIAHFAHLGGALLGFLMMWYWKKNQFNGNRWN